MGPCDICGREAVGGVSVFSQWTRLCADDLADWKKSPEKKRYDTLEHPFERARLFGAWVQHRKDQHRFASDVIKLSRHG